MSIVCVMVGQTYTLREVAALVSKSSDPNVIERLARQIRHWTAEDLIETIGEKHGGTGVHRRYDAKGVRRAAIIEELVRYGITIAALDTFGEYLEINEGKEDWESAIVGEKIVFLSYAKSTEEGGLSIMQVGTRNFYDPLSLLEAVKNEDYGAGVLDVQEFASILVINLTKIFSRLDLA